ncbi:hypothetical protein HYU21_02990 [Candidatus Woesearchaeota archaeon]|nr:hypothetical protein [Candidatus Woesearchaeota archaeon]
MHNHLLKNHELARTVADITGDGHLQIKEWRYLTSFYSKNIEEIEAVKERFFRLFGVEERIYVDNSTSKRNPKSCKRYKLFIISKPVASFLRDIGTTVGNKTNQRFTIPDWIFNGSDEIRSAYLRGLFDNEGSIFCRNTLKPRWQIGFKMVKNENIVDSGIIYLDQIRELLSKFNIHCSPVRKHKLNIRKDGSQSIDLMFNIEKNSFRNFLKQVGFEHKDKQNKLLQSLRPSPSG